MAHGSPPHDFLVCLPALAVLMASYCISYKTRRPPRVRWSNEKRGRSYWVQIYDCFSWMANFYMQFCAILHLSLKTFKMPKVVHTLFTYHLLINSQFIIHNSQFPFTSMAKSSRLPAARLFCPFHATKPLTRNQSSKHLKWKSRVTFQPERLRLIHVILVK